MREHEFPWATSLLKQIEGGVAVGVILEKKDPDGNKVYRINKRQRKGFYYLREDAGQRKFCKKIRLIGFEKLPTGFYRDNGFGLRGIGQYLLREMHGHFNKQLDITITADGNPSLPSTRSPVPITIPHSELRAANQAVGVVNRRKNAQNIALAKGLLAQLFPQEFDQFKGHRAGYIPGSIAGILSQKQVTANMDNDDRSAIDDFIS